MLHTLIMQKNVILLLIFFLLVGSTLSGLVVNELYKTIVDRLECKEGGYIWLPKKVSELFYGDTLNLHFFLLDGRQIHSYGVVSEGKISNLKCGSTSDYDFDISMTDINAIELSISDKPVTTFVHLWRAGQIKVKSSNLANEEKLDYADQMVAFDNEPVPENIQNITKRYVERN